MCCFGRGDARPWARPMKTAADLDRYFADELQGYRAGRGTIRLDPTKPLPIALIVKLVRARVAENEAKAAAPKQRR
jgi:uncharacterized protein YdhG (YjbR/CyaY superfamily)